jgi:hypothetical protein
MQSGSQLVRPSVRPTEMAVLHRPTGGSGHPHHHPHRQWSSLVAAVAVGACKRRLGVLRGHEVLHTHNRTHTHTYTYKAEQSAESSADPPNRSQQTQNGLRRGTPVIEPLVRL